MKKLITAAVLLAAVPFVAGTANADWSPWVHPQFADCEQPSTCGPSYSGPSYEGPSYEGPSYSGPSYSGPSYE